MWPELHIRANNKQTLELIKWKRSWFLESSLNTHVKCWQCWREKSVNPGSWWLVKPPLWTLREYVWVASCRTASARTHLSDVCWEQASSGYSMARLWGWGLVSVRTTLVDWLPYSGTLSCCISKCLLWFRWLIAQPVDHFGKLGNWFPCNDDGAAPAPGGPGLEAVKQVHITMLPPLYFTVGMMFLFVA